FSFQQSKIMTAGEGGLCITDDENLYDLIGRYSHIGYQLGAKQGKPAAPPPENLDSRNYRATEFQAVILQDQLATLEEDSRRRAANADYLHKELRSIPGLSTQEPGRCATMQQYYVYGITVDPAALKEGKTRDDVIKAVNAEGVTQVFAGWGEPAFRQRLFKVSPERYRVASSSVVEEIIHNRIILAGIQWLDGDRSLCEKFVEAFRKVMGEYAR
ncbi:MAG: DegT/DnrJ/EryC1/StrS family aminotransferase, partial [Lentisphaeria bacterium]|nr:DegT/DnrJ/EryC1/StrS family aminotransferase [Lentisphaeria bacterium]